MVAVTSHGFSKAGGESFNPGLAVTEGHLAEIMPMVGWNSDFAIIVA